MVPPSNLIVNIERKSCSTPIASRLQSCQSNPSSCFRFGSEKEKQESRESTYSKEISIMANRAEVDTFATSLQ